MSRTFSEPAAANLDFPRDFPSKFDIVKLYLDAYWSTTTSPFANSCHRPCGAVEHRDEDESFWLCRPHAEEY